MKKLTILYICIDSSIGGSTASLYNLIDSVKEYVNPIVLFRNNGVGVDLFLKKGIECHVFPFLDLSCFFSNNLLDVWRHPWRWHYIKKWRSDIGCVKYVKEILKGRHIDIVHTNTSPNDIGFMLAKFLHAKHIWHVRECLDVHGGVELYGGMSHMKKMINQADARIAISNFVAKHWQMCEKNTYVIHDAIRSQRDISYVSKKDKYILFSSYFLTEPKGTRDTIIAFSKSQVWKDSYRLKLLGNCDVEYKSSLLQTIQEKEITNYVDFVPCQINVRPFYEKASAFIMASKNEGLGRTTAEAMFYGSPVIAYASGGTLDLVKDGETGYLFNTIDECAQLIRKVCTENQEEIILRAQEFAVNNLSQEVYGPKIMEVYNHVLGLDK